MSYLDEFPKEFHPDEDEVEKIVWAGGVDASWHNDVCPCWIWGIEGAEEKFIYLRVDAVDSKQREMPEHPRLIASLNDENTTTIYEGDNLEDALLTIDNRLTS